MIWKDKLDSITTTTADGKDDDEVHVDKLHGNEYMEKYVSSWVHE